MVRLVFRPYTQIPPPICTSGRLRTSTSVSTGFIPSRHRSPSFGSYRPRSPTLPLQCSPRLPTTPSEALFDMSLSLRIRACHSYTRGNGRLLGPCYKTGPCWPLPHTPSLLQPWTHVPLQPVGLSLMQFHALFTSVSGFFSSFPHGTFSLSVSRQII